MHFFGIGEGELQHQVGQTAFHRDTAIGQCTVALDIGDDILELDGAIAHFLDIGLHGADGQLAAYLLAHLCRALLGDVDAERGRAVDVFQSLQLEDFAQGQGVGAESACQVFGVSVELEIEVQVAFLRIEQAPELLFLPKDIETAVVFDDAQGIELVHHVFLDHELVDDLVLDARFRHHVVYLEVERQLPGFSQVAQVAGGVDNEFVVVAIDVDAPEVHALVGAEEAHTQVQWYREILEYGCKGLGDILQDGTAVDGVGLVAQGGAVLFAGQRQFGLGNVEARGHLLDDGIGEIYFLADDGDIRLQLCQVDAGYRVRGTASHESCGDGVLADVQDVDTQVGSHV